MAENEKKPSKKPKRKGKVDTPTMIFFIVMVVGLIVLTIIMFTRPTSKIYTKAYGEDFIVSVELYSNGNIDIAVDAKNDRVLQSGKYEEIKDDDIENNYIATFEENENDKTVETKVNLLIVEDELTLTYEDGSSVVFKEKK